MMRSWISAVLIGCLAAPAVNLTAEEKDDKLASWSRVRKLPPATEILLSVDGSQPRERLLVSADDAGLVSLDRTNPQLPPAATHVLSKWVATHPEYFLDVFRSGQFVDQTVRLDREGVFVSDRKIADVHDLLDADARPDVAQIVIRRKGRGFWGHLGLLGGYFVGAMAGGYIAGFGCQAVSERSRCDNGAFLTGALVGGVTGAVHGFRASNRVTEEVLYQASPKD